MSNGFGSFLSGAAQGVSMGLQAKNFNKGQTQNDTSQVQAPLGTQAVQATAQNAANGSSGLSAGLSAFTQPGMTKNGNEAGGSIWSNLQSLIGGGK